MQTRLTINMLSRADFFQRTNGETGNNSREPGDSWTELGAKQVGIIQSLLTACRLHDIDRYTYLVDVLQRVGQHPAADVALLTPRLWKWHFAHNPLRSDLDTHAGK
jgi:hypothetical protein